MIELRTERSAQSGRVSVWKRAIAGTALMGAVAGGASMAGCTSEKLDATRYRQAGVTLQEGDDPTSIVQCVDGEYAPEHSKMRSLLIDFVGKQDFEVSAQVTVPMLNEQVAPGLDGSKMPVIAVNCD
jgi:hypothetical protein